MTLKEIVFHELETADDLLLEDLLKVIRSRQTPKPTMTITDAIAAYREEAIAIPADFNKPMSYN